MLDRLMISPEAVHRCVEAAASSAGSVTGIVLGAVRDITEEITTLGAELIEITDAAVRGTDDD